MSIDDHVSGTRLRLDLWHPNCWAIEVTERTEGGVLAYAYHDFPPMEPTAPASVTGLFTAFGHEETEVDGLLDAVRASDRTGDLLELQQRFGRRREAPGNVVQEFVLEYDPRDMMGSTLHEHGFIQSAPVRIENGKSEWEVCFAEARSELEGALERVCEEAGAEANVVAVTTCDLRSGTEREQRLDSLTAAQRNAFEHASDAGYYEWPRETSTRELAADLDLSKTTLLEHLRKAEAKLLDP